MNNPDNRRAKDQDRNTDTGPAPAAPPRILLVEDHVDTAFLIRIILERNGFMVTVVHTLHDAMASAIAGPPDLLLSDIMLPDGTGWELLAALKQRVNVKSIAVSALSSYDDLRKSTLAGFDRHMMKPVKTDLLCATIAEVLTEQRGIERKNPNVVTDGGDSRTSS